MIVLGDRSFIYAVVFFWFSIATQVVVNAQFESNQLDQRRRDCGANYTGVEGNISSPNFGVKNYDPDTECTWIITVPPNMVVRLDFDSIDIEVEQQCVFDGVVMYDYLPGFEVDVTNYEDNTPYLGNTRLCGSDAYPPMISHTNRVVIKFYSDSSDEEAGFQLHWTAVEFPTERDFNCSFDQGLCAGWKYLFFPDDNQYFNWTLNSGNTPTAGTGPLFDHTMQNQNGKYLYIESSFPRKENDIAMLESPTIIFGEDHFTACLSFWYHKRGDSIGKLLVAKNDTNYPVIWMQSGQQGEAWINGRVQLQRNASNPFKVIFIATTGMGFRGDIAIDDVTFSLGNCQEENGNVIEGQFLNGFLQITNRNENLSTPPPTDIFCSADLYRCISGTICLPTILLCDGHQDCPDNDDEFSCGPPETTTARLDEADKHHSYRQTATTSSTNQENKAKSSNNTAQEPPTQPPRIDMDFTTTSASSSSTSIKGFSTVTLVLVLGTGTNLLALR